VALAAGDDAALAARGRRLRRRGAARQPTRRSSPRSRAGCSALPPTAPGSRSGATSQPRSAPRSQPARQRSRYCPVRAALLDVQRRLAATGGVVWGRDVGSVVFPDAGGLFLTADVHERARRRTARARGSRPGIRCGANQPRRPRHEACGSAWYVPGALIVDSSALQTGCGLHVRRVTMRERKRNPGAEGKGADAWCTNSRHGE
jgi:hypothetical protein